MVQVDFVVMSNGTSWKYGLLHRQDPNDPNFWVPISKINRQSLLNRWKTETGEAKLEMASMRLKNSYVVCKSFGGYHLFPRADCTACNVYDEVWTIDPCNGWAESGDIPWHCPDETICYKNGYVTYVDDCFRDTSPPC